MGAIYAMAAVMDLKSPERRVLMDARCSTGGRVEVTVRDAHAGTLSAENAPDGGAILRVSLPVMKAIAA